MNTKPLIILSLFILTAISTIIYYVSQTLSELGLWKSLFIVASFFALWGLIPFFMTSLYSIIREVRYIRAKSKNQKNNGNTEAESGKV